MKIYTTLSDLQEQLASIARHPAVKNRVVDVRSERGVLSPASVTAVLVLHANGEPACVEIR